MKKTGLVAAVFLALILCAGAIAQDLWNTPSLADSPAIAMEAELGYRGAVTYMRHIPFTVTLRNDGPDLEGTVSVNLYRNQTEYDRYEMPVTLASGAEKRVVLPVKPQMKQDSYRIELSVNGAVVKAVEKKPDRMINPEAVLVGVLSNDTQSVSYMNTTLKSASPDRSESWQLAALDTKSFPSTDDLMDSFMLLVVDGFDMSSLPEEKRLVFDRWLKAGGIVLVGGGAQAATDYPFFKKYTGLAAGGLVKDVEITNDLKLYAVIDKAPLEQPVLLNEVSGGGSPLVSASGHPLVFLHQAGNGCIYTAAFELGLKPLTDWAGIGSLWPRVILKSASDLYAGRYNALANNVWGGGYRNDTYLLNMLPVENSGSIVPAVALLTVYVLLMGIGSYLLLKKLDKREWMWVSVPLLAVVCMAGLYGLSKALPYAKPMAVSLTSIQVNEQGQAAVMCSAAVAGPETGESVIQMEGGGTLNPVDNENYYVDMPDTEKKEPTELKFRILLGDEPGIGFQAGPSWTVNRFTLPDTGVFEGQVKASIWLEEDGLHAEIVNNTPYALEQGMMITGLGYALLDDLLPGQTARPSLLRDLEEEKKAKVPAYPAAFQSGQMVSPSMTRMAGMELYGFLHAAIFPEEQLNPASPYDYQKNLSSAELQERSFKESILSQLFNSDWTRAGIMNGNASPFHFMAFTREIGTAGIYVNGKPVTRTGSRAAIDIMMTFEPVGPTGIVYYPPGTLPVYGAELDLNGTPSSIKQELYGKNSYFQLNQMPAFCFQIPDLAGITLDALTVFPSNYDSTPVLRLYNHQTGVWDEQEFLFTPLSGEEVKPYISANGELFVQFAPGAASRDYEGMTAPALMLEGRQK